MSLKDRLFIDKTDISEWIIVVQKTLRNLQSFEPLEVNFYVDDLSDRDKYFFKLIYSKNHNVKSIEKGPGFSEEYLKKIISDLKRYILEVQNTKVVRRILFNQIQTTSYWRYKNLFQICPPPSNAPLPDMIGPFPFVIEFTINHSGYFPLDIHRNNKEFKNLHLILSVLLEGYINYESLSEWVWVMPKGEEQKVPSQLSCRGYFFEGFESLADDFSSFEANEKMKAIPSDVYYGNGNNKDNVLRVSDIFDRAIDIFFNLQDSLREKFLTSCFWLYQSRQLHRHSISASFTAITNSIENLIEELKPVGRCSNCNRDIVLKGNKQQFSEFVDRYASNIPSSIRKDLYAIRSKLAHGGLLEEDLHGYIPGLQSKSIQDELNLRRIQAIARPVLINWLFDLGSTKLPVSE